MMALVGGQLTEMANSAVLANANSGVATCFAGAAGNGGPLAALKGAHNFTKLPILPNISFGEIFVPNSYKFGGSCWHAKVRGLAVVEIFDSLLVLWNCGIIASVCSALVCGYGRSSFLVFY